MNKNTKSVSSLRQLVRATRGANMVEYIMLVGLVALICLTGYKLFGEKIQGKIHEQTTTVDNVTTGPGT